MGIPRWLTKLVRPLRAAPQNGALTNGPAVVDASVQIKNEQERAIAARIHTAEFVKIEEEYGSVAAASVGLQGGSGTVQAGMTGSNEQLRIRRITLIGGHRPESGGPQRGGQINV